MLRIHKLWLLEMSQISIMLQLDVTENLFIKVFAGHNLIKVLHSNPKKGLKIKCNSSHQQ